MARHALPGEPAYFRKVRHAAHSHIHRRSTAVVRPAIASASPAHTPATTSARSCTPYPLPLPLPLPLTKEEKKAEAPKADDAAKAAKEREKFLAKIIKEGGKKVVLRLGLGLGLGLGSARVRVWVWVWVWVWVRVRARAHGGTPPLQS